MSAVGARADAAPDVLVADGVGAPAAQDLPWGRLTGSADPDGTRWAVQQLRPRSS